MNAALLSVGILVGPMLGGADAQPPYPYPYPSYQPPPGPPPSAYYNPYTSGLGPCPQRWPGDPPCSQTLSPSYGQPSYWPRP